MTVENRCYTDLTEWATSLCAEYPGFKSTGKLDGIYVYHTGILVAYFDLDNSHGWVAEEVQVPKFEINEHVIIIEHEGDEYNERGRVQSFNEKTGLYWVVNMNMPFMGTVSERFSPYELRKIV